MNKVFAGLSTAACLLTMYGWFVQKSYELVFYGTAGYIVLSVIMLCARIIKVQSLGVDVLIFGIGFIIGGFVETPSLLLGCLAMCTFEFVINAIELFRGK